MSGVRPDRQEYKWEHAWPIMPCGLADLQPADGLAAAGCHLAARRASQVATDGECEAVGYFASDFLSRNREVGRRRLDASTLGADGRLKVEKPHDHCCRELIISLRIQPQSREPSIFLLRGRLCRVLAPPFARRAGEGVWGPGAGARTGIAQGMTVGGGQRVIASSTNVSGTSIASRGCAMTHARDFASPQHFLRTSCARQTVSTCKSLDRRNSS
jgi:hypothetical protein